MKTFKFIPLLLITLVSVMLSCSDDNDTYNDSYIQLIPSSLEVGRSGGTHDVELRTNQTGLVATSDASWATASIADNKLQIKVESNSNLDSRKATITVKNDQVSSVMILTQLGLNSSLEEIKDDIKIKVSSAEASSFQNGEGIENSIDGDYTTMYHSAWNNAVENYFPITLSYFFEDVAAMDYLIYNPRQTGSNGHIKEVEIWIATAENPTLTKYGDYDFMGSSTATRVDFEKSLIKPTQVQFVVKSGTGDGIGFVACSEMEFYQKNPDNFDYLTIFTDNSCSEIKNGLTEADLTKIESRFYRDLALDIFRGTYDDEFRIQEYSSWQNPDVMAKINKTERYGLRDNPTGIYAKTDEEIIVFANDHDASVSIFIQDPDNKISGTSFALANGLNKIVAPHDGLMYVMYYTKTGTEPAVKINIVTGTVNGYFDNAKHKAEDWKRILNKATFDRFDLIGKHVVMTFQTEAFKSYTPDGLELINLYDEMVRLEQDFMGLFKYNKEYNNRTYMLGISDSYMYATAYYTAYNFDTQSAILNPAKVKSTDMWGPAHEIGHIHQTRPGLKWLGMTEVTNNIHSLYVQTSFGAQSRLITDGYYAAAKNEIVGKIAHNASTDVFYKLVPFWQLKLYVQDALGKTDFYKDVYEAVRVNNDPATDGEAQLQFVKIACDAAQLDLTDFFTSWGFLTPIDVTMEDYSTARFTITQAQIDQVKADIVAKGYPKPVHNNIYDITDENVSSFKN